MKPVIERLFQEAFPVSVHYLWCIVFLESQMLRDNNNNLLQARNLPAANCKLANDYLVANHTNSNKLACR